MEPNVFKANRSVGMKQILSYRLYGSALTRISLVFKRFPTSIIQCLFGALCIRTLIWPLYNRSASPCAWNCIRKPLTSASVFICMVRILMQYVCIRQNLNTFIMKFVSMFFRFTILLCEEREGE